MHVLSRGATVGLAALVVATLPTSLAWPSVQRCRWHIAHAYIHERFVCVLTNNKSHSRPEHFCPWSTLRARRTANGSAHPLHILRSISPTSALGVCVSPVGPLKPALLSCSVHAAPVTGVPYCRHSSHMSVPLLRTPSEHVEHFHTVVVGVSQMAHLPFRTCTYILRSTQWARLECVRWSRLLRSSNSAHWFPLPSSVLLPLLWVLVLRLVFASHLSSAFSFRQHFPFLQ